MNTSRDTLAIDNSKLADGAPVEWRVEPGLLDYQPAVAFMEARVAAIAAGDAPELVWLVEHPALYTAGTSAEASDLVDGNRFPVHKTGRGGQYTYHGPGQRVAYVMLDLTRRGQDVRRFVAQLEDWLIRTLDTFNVKGERREDRVGVWVRRSDKGANVEDKIAAIGIRVRRWISYHGLSVNVAPDIAHFSGIVPCGIADQGVTSLADLGVNAAMQDLDAALHQTFQDRFGPCEPGPAPLVISR